MLALYSGYGDGTKGGDLQGIHLDYVSKANLACRLSSASYHRHGHLLVRVDLKGLHIVVVIVLVTDDDPSESRQILQGNTIRFAVIIAGFLRKPGIGQHPVPVEVDEHARVCNTSNSQRC